MPLCPHCVHLNPVNTQRCQKCGKWISTDPEPVADDTAADGSLSNESAAKPEQPIDVEPLPESEVDQPLRDLVARGQKIEAIRQYREQTGAGLADAKRYVESIGTRAPLPVAGLDHEIYNLLRHGRKISAIKLYREQSGVSLKQAKEHVETLGRRHGLSTSSVGCSTNVLAILLLAVAGYFIWQMV